MILNKPLMFQTRRNRSEADGQRLRHGLGRAYKPPGIALELVFLPCRRTGGSCPQARTALATNLCSLLWIWSLAASISLRSTGLSPPR
jgi:hypothetical protein